MRCRYAAGVSTIGVAAAVYILFARPRQLRWGASARECEASLPGDDLIVSPDLTATRAGRLVPLAQAPADRGVRHAQPPRQDAEAVPGEIFGAAGSVSEGCDGRQRTSVGRPGQVLQVVRLLSPVRPVRRL